MTGVFVTGTDTGVGKTVLAACLLAAWRGEGREVRAYKPVLTGLDDPPEAGWPADDELLGAAAGRPAEEVAPVRFGPPVSPHLAAAEAGVELDVEELAAPARALAAEADVLVVEGVGGLRVPLSATEDVRDLARALALPLLVAARPGLGTLNHTLLTLESARAAGLEVRAVVLTPWPDAPGAVEESNRETLAARAGAPVHVLPRLPDARPATLAAAGARLPLGDHR